MVPDTMVPEFVLQIASTGKVLKKEETDKTALAWFNFWTKRFLRYQRTNAEVKKAIREGDLIVGWSNFDACKAAGMSHEEIVEILRRFDSYHRKYWPET